MTSKVAEGLQRVKELVENMQPGEQKVADLARDTTDVNGCLPFTTDHGVKVSNTDFWLRLASENQTGPSLLEDQIAREKVSPTSLVYLPIVFQALRATYGNHRARSIDLTMKESQNVLSMHEEQVLLGTSSSSRARQT